MNLYPSFHSRNWKWIPETMPPGTASNGVRRLTVSQFLVLDALRLET